MDTTTAGLEEAIQHLNERLQKDSERVLDKNAVAQFMEETGMVGEVLKQVDSIVARALPSGARTEIFQFARSADQALGDLVWSTRSPDDARLRAEAGGHKLVEASTWCNVGRSAKEGLARILHEA